MNAQEIVAANVAARGYRDGWTAEQFVARQLAKMTEELAETSLLIGNVNSFGWLKALQEAGQLARTYFDYREYWEPITVNRGLAKPELADMLVVLFAAAEALDFDIVQAAIDKSSADVARGVR